MEKKTVNNIKAYKEIIGICSKCGCAVYKEIDKNLKEDYLGYCPNCDENLLSVEINFEKINATHEICPHCENEVPLLNKLIKQVCPNCNEEIYPCSMCDIDNLNCNNCPIEK